VPLGRSLGLFSHTTELGLVFFPGLVGAAQRVVQLLVSSLHGGAGFIEAPFLFVKGLLSQDSSLVQLGVEPLSIRFGLPLSLLELQLVVLGCTLGFEQALLGAREGLSLFFCLALSQIPGGL
jgi:hypothetical protein